MSAGCQWRCPCGMALLTLHLFTPSSCCGFSTASVVHFGASYAAMLSICCSAAVAQWLCHNNSMLCAGTAGDRWVGAAVQTTCTRRYAYVYVEGALYHYLLAALLQQRAAAAAATRVPCVHLFNTLVATLCCHPGKSSRPGFSGCSSLYT